MTHPALLPLLLAPLAPTGALQEGAAPAAAQEAPKPLMTMGMGDMTKMQHHPKDAALINAMTMLDERLAELPAEMGRDLPPELGPAFQPDSIPTWMRLLTAQKRVSMAAAPMGGGGDMPFLFSVAVDETNEETAAAYEASLSNLLQKMQAPFNMGDFVQRNGASLEFSMGAELAPMGGSQSAQLLGSDHGPLGFEMNMNIGGYMSMLKDMMMQEGAPPEALMMFDIMDRIGLSDAQVDVASACNGTTSHMASVLSNLGGRMAAAGIIPEGGLSAAHFAPVPADATWASVTRMDLEAVFEGVNSLAMEIMQEQGGGMGDIGEMVKGMFGLDLRAGLFGALGDTYGVYASETTGGGGMTSTVMFFSLRDSEALLETKELLEELVNGLAASETQGYVNIRTWTQGDNEYSTLMFPGLPVPMEATVAFGEEWLVLAATPQAAMGAMNQIATGGASLAAHPEIAPLLASGTKTAVGFMDTGYFARTGYGLTAMSMSAISNGVRSRVDGLRDPGPIMPMFPMFKEGIQDTVSYSEIRGDDMITMQKSDGSMLVQMAMTMGFLQENAGFLLIPAMAAGGVAYSQVQAVIPGDY